jgi:hypothetical protein
MSLTNRDPNQIVQFEHEDKHNAKRVFVVGQELSIDSSKIAESLEKALEKVSFKMPTQPQVESIEKTIFIPQLEVKTIEVPVIVKEIEYREIQIPVVIEKIVTVEIPVIVKETEIKYINNESSNPFSMKMGTIIRDVCMLGLMIYHLFSHLK